MHLSYRKNLFINLIVDLVYIETYNVIHMVSLTI